MWENITVIRLVQADKPIIFNTIHPPYFIPDDKMVYTTQTFLIGHTPMNAQNIASTPIAHIRERLKHMTSRFRAFPHITRLFSAKAFSGFIGKALLWFALLFVIVANVYMAYGNTNGAMRAMSAYVLHIIPDKGKQKNVLGTADTKPKNGVNKTATHKSYEYWKSVIRDHPDYRDGYIQAAMRAYELGLFSEAHGYIEKAKSIDPNFTGILSIEDQLSKE